MESIFIVASVVKLILLYYVFVYIGTYGFKIVFLFMSKTMPLGQNKYSLSFEKSFPYKILVCKFSVAVFYPKHNKFHIFNKRFLKM